MSNPIAIGFAWRQAFDFPSSFFETGDEVRAEFRRFATDAAPLASVVGGAGTRIDGDRLFVELAPEQTEKFPTGTVVTNFVIVRASVEFAIGSIVTVPVVLLPTRPKP